MPILESRGSGSAYAYGLGSPSGFNDMFQPAGTSRVLGLKFDSALTTTVSGSSYTVSTTTTPPSLVGAGGVGNGYATNFSQNEGSGLLTSGRGLIINSLPVINGGNWTFVAWYKGTQTASRYDTMPSGSGQPGPQWGPTIPMFGDPRGSVYVGLGLEFGKIAATEYTSYFGGKSIADNEWHCLVWTVNTSNRINAWVDGYQVLVNMRTYQSPANNRLDYIAQTYNYGTPVASPTNLDGIQIYNQVLTDSQIKQIASEGGSLKDPYVYARYWRVRLGTTTEGHQPRWSRIVMRDKAQTIYNVSVATTDNCSDSGTIGGGPWNYDAGSGNTVAMVGGGLYVTYAGGRRGAIHHLEYSNDNSNWTEYNRADLHTNDANMNCGLYLTDGTVP
jgi:hypothetical protein